MKNALTLVAGAILAAPALHVFALNTLTINDGGTINLGNRTYTSITITNGTGVDNISTPITNTLTFGGTTNSWTGTLDLQANKMIVQPTSGKATAFANLQNQAAYGATHSAGILSSAMPAHMGIAVLDNAVTNFSTFGGQMVNGNSLLLSPELLGDANVDGHVDLTDLNIVLNNFGMATSNWTSGNFDYAPTINLTDLSDVLNNFGLSNSSPFLLAAGSTQAMQSAPEPASLGFAGFVMVALHLRRRRLV